MIYCKNCDGWSGLVWSVVAVLSTVDVREYPSLRLEASVHKFEGLPSLFVIRSWIFPNVRQPCRYFLRSGILCNRARAPHLVFDEPIKVITRDRCRDHMPALPISRHPIWGDNLRFGLPEDQLLVEATADHPLLCLALGLAKTNRGGR